MKHQPRNLIQTMTTKIRLLPTKPRKLKHLAEYRMTIQFVQCTSKLQQSTSPDGYRTNIRTTRKSIQKQSKPPYPMRRIYHQRKSKHRTTTKSRSMLQLWKGQTPLSRLPWTTTSVTTIQTTTTIHNHRPQRRRT